VLSAGNIVIFCRDRALLPALPEKSKFDAIPGRYMGNIGSVKIFQEGIKGAK